MGGPVRETTYVHKYNITGGVSGVWMFLLYFLINSFILYVARQHLYISFDHIFKHYFMSLLTIIVVLIVSTTMTFLVPSDIKKVRL